MSRWKQGDTLPEMIIDTFADSRSRPDLRDAAEVTVIANRRGETVWVKEVEGTADGVLTVPLEPEDVAEPGAYFVKVKVVWPDGGQQHYPPADDWMKMTVTR